MKVAVVLLLAIKAMVDLCVVAVAGPLCAALREWFYHFLFDNLKPRLQMMKMSMQGGVDLGACCSSGALDVRTGAVLSYHVVEQY
ncbi:hypothetical protein PG984_000156 [Apiospora sp. TS-2023a]